jgi:hypothetical protein
VLSGTLDFIEGIAWDGFPTTRAPQRVEVSINGGSFVQASVSKVQRALLRNGVETEAAVWRLPLRFDGYDGQTLQVTARAVDEAGNASTVSSPMTLTLDSVGPSIAVTQTGRLLAGMVSDGSGVAAVSVSLDGGSTYQPMVRRGDEVRFDLGTWLGGSVQPLAMVRATDLHGNVTVVLAPVTVVAPSPIYLPLVYRNMVMATREDVGGSAEATGEDSEMTATPTEASAADTPDAEANTSNQTEAANPDPFEETPTGSWQLFLPSISQGTTVSRQ